MPSATTYKSTAAVDETAQITPEPELKGRLVLVTGEVVEVPTEGLEVSTEHYSEKYGATVKVTGSFLVD